MDGYEARYQMVKTVLNGLKQEQREEVSPARLLMAVYNFANEKVDTRFARLPKHDAGMCGMTIYGEVKIEIAKPRFTDGGVYRTASVLTHELVHAFKHYGVGGNPLHPGVERGVIHPWEFPEMELEAELNAYAVMTAFTKHPYIRRTSREYIETWHHRTWRTVPLHGCVDHGLIHYLTESIAARV